VACAVDAVREQWPDGQGVLPARVGQSPASLYRWRSLLGTAADIGYVPVASASSRTPAGFVDLGPLLAPSSSPSFELHLDLGGGLTNSQRIGHLPPMEFKGQRQLPESLFSIGVG